MRKITRPSLFWFHRHKLYLNASKVQCMKYCWRDQQPWVECINNGLHHKTINYGSRHGRLANSEV